MTTPRSLTKISDKHYVANFIVNVPPAGIGVQFHGAAYPRVMLKSVDNETQGYIADTLSGYGVIRLNGNQLVYVDNSVDEPSTYTTKFVISQGEIVTVRIASPPTEFLNNFIYSQTTNYSDASSGTGPELISEERILSPTYPPLVEGLPQYSIAYASRQGSVPGVYYFTGYKLEDDTVAVYVSEFWEGDANDGYQLFSFEDDVERQKFQSDFVRMDDDYFYLPASDGIGLIRAKRDGSQADKWIFECDDPNLIVDYSYCLGASDTHFYYYAEQYVLEEDSNYSVIVKVNFAATEYDVLWIDNLNGGISGFTYDPANDRLLLATLGYDPDAAEFIGEISFLALALDSGLHEEPDTLNSFAVTSISSLVTYGETIVVEENDRVRGRIRNDRQITKIMLRRGHGIDLPGKPRAIHPKTWNAPLAEGELAFSNDEGRLFIGPNQNSTLPQATRMKYPYQNIEVIGENSVKAFSAMHGNRMKEGDSRDYYTATLLRKGAVSGSINSALKITCSAMGEE